MSKHSKPNPDDPLKITFYSFDEVYEDIFDANKKYHMQILVAGRVAQRKRFLSDGGIAYLK